MTILPVALQMVVFLDEVWSYVRWLFLQKKTQNRKNQTNKEHYSTGKKLSLDMIIPREKIGSYEDTKNLSICLEIQSSTPMA